MSSITRISAERIGRRGAIAVANEYDRHQAGACQRHVIGAVTHHDGPRCGPAHRFNDMAHHRRGRACVPPAYRRRLWRRNRIAVQACRGWQAWRPSACLCTPPVWRRTRAAAQAHRRHREMAASVPRGHAYTASDNAPTRPGCVCGGGGVPDAASARSTSTGTPSPIIDLIRSMSSGCRPNSASKAFTQAARSGAVSTNVPSRSNTTSARASDGSMAAGARTGVDLLSRLKLFIAVECLAE